MATGYEVTQFRVVADALPRIATALERIADALELVEKVEMDAKVEEMFGG